MKKVCIKYGIGEEDYHGKRFVAALRDAGFDITRDDREADIIVTHSGGCFFLPAKAKRKPGQLLFFINPPYWPGKSLAISTVQKVSLDYIDFARDGKIVQWHYKTGINIAHILRYILRTLTITLHARKQRFYDVLDDDTTTIIRSQKDAFLTPKAEEMLRKKAARRFQYYEIPGQHDTCWRDPGPCIDIIRKHASTKV